MADVMVLKTGRLFEAEILVDALTRAGVPHYERQESFSGVQFAMPAFPAQGPGVFFAVFVPEEAAEGARAILAELPIEHELPGVMAFRPREKYRRGFQIYVWLMLGSVALGFIVQICEWLGLW